MPSHLTERQTASTNAPSSRFDFGKIAECYDRWYQTQRGLAYDKLEKQAINRLLPDAGKDDRLLEVGCGTGHWSAYFASKGFDVTGIDISEAMLCIARKKRIAGSCFQAADAENLPFADNQFDMVTAITALEFTTHSKRTLSEMVRCVKKPKGTLIVGTLNALSLSNQAKKARRGSVYASADFLSPHGLEKLMSQFGKVDIQTVGFASMAEWFLPLSPVVDYLHRLLGSKQGAFIAAKVTL